jgi:hypothetical protein
MRRVIEALFRRQALNPARPRSSSASVPHTSAHCGRSPPVPSRARSLA